MKKAIGLLLFLVSLFAPKVGAQGVPYTITPPVPNGTLRVCTYNGPPMPAFPCPVFATIYTAANLVTPISQPVSLGASGTTTFYGAVGQQLVVQISVSGILSQQFILTVPSPTPPGGVVGSTSFSALTPGINSTAGNFQWAQLGTFSSSGFFEPYGVSLSTGAGCVPSTIYTTLYITGTNVDGFYGCVNEPVGSTNQQANGLSGYATSAANSSNRTVANAVGVFGLGYCTGNNCAVWGMNSIASDSAGVTADNMESLEVDQNIFGSPTYISALQVNGVSHAGAVFPANAAEVDLIYNGPVIWPIAIHVKPGVSPIGAWFDGLAASSSASQTVKFTAYNGAVAANYGHMVDAGTNYHLNGPGNVMFGATVGSLAPNTPAAPTAALLAYTGFLSATSITSSSVTLIAGHSVVVGIQSGINGANSITGITDTRGNSYKRLSSATAGSRDMEFWISPCLVFPGTATITATQGSSNAIGFFAWDVTGVNCSQPLAINGNSLVASATSTAGAVGTITTSSPNEIILAFNIGTALGTFTVGSGYTLDQGGSSTSLGAEHQVFATAGTANTAPITLSGSTTWWEGAISLQSSPQLGTPNNPWPAVTASQYQTATNCAVNSASPAACGSAASGVFAIPTTTTSYTVNTSAVAANSRIFLEDITDNTGIPSAPTCTTLALTAVAQISARSAGVSFTITLPSTTGITCFNYWIVN